MFLPQAIFSLSMPGLFYLGDPPAVDQAEFTHSYEPRSSQVGESILAVHSFCGSCAHLFRSKLEAWRGNRRAACQPQGTFTARDWMEWVEARKDRTLVCKLTSTTKNILDPSTA